MATEVCTLRLNNMSCGCWGVFDYILEFVSIFCYLLTHVHLGIVIKCLAHNIVIKTYVSCMPKKDSVTYSQYVLCPALRDRDSAGE